MDKILSKLRLRGPCLVTRNVGCGSRPADQADVSFPREIKDGFWLPFETTSFSSGR